MYHSTLWNILFQFTEFGTYLHVPQTDFNFLYVRNGQLKCQYLEFLVCIITLNNLNI